jgi:mono/diheme cytochrome c family protein
MRALKRFTTAGASGLIFLLGCGGGDAGQETQATQQQAQTRTAQAQTPAGETAQSGEGMQEQTDLPEGVTQEMVAQGRQIFGAAGLCYACHGQEGKGMPNLGADLTDDEWIHIDGSYESIVQNIMTGVTAGQSSTGTPMPPKGGSGITDEQVRAVAAYVWTLSH